MGREVPLFGKPVRIKFNHKYFLKMLFFMVSITGLFGYFWPRFFNESFTHGSLYCISVAEILGLIHVFLISNYALSYDYHNRAVVVYVFIFLMMTSF